MTHRCPTCPQLVRVPAAPSPPVRVCYNCDGQISRHHKFIYALNKDGISVVIHRVCSDPDSYHDARTNKNIGVVGYKNLTEEQVKERERVAAILERGFEEWRISAGRTKID